MAMRGRNRCGFAMHASLQRDRGMGRYGEKSKQEKTEK
jgi:hypothetical protein